MQAAGYASTAGGRGAVSLSAPVTSPFCCCPRPRPPVSPATPRPPLPERTLLGLRPESLSPGPTRTRPPVPLAFCAQDDTRYLAARSKHKAWGSGHHGVSRGQRGAAGRPSAPVPPHQAPHRSEGSPGARCPRQEHGGGGTIFLSPDAE